jgi:hypothetical protein
MRLIKPKRRRQEIWTDSLSEKSQSARQMETFDKLERGRDTRRLGILQALVRVGHDAQGMSERKPSLARCREAVTNAGWRRRDAVFLP